MKKKSNQHLYQGERVGNKACGATGEATALRLLVLIDSESASSKSSSPHFESINDWWILMMLREYVTDKKAEVGVGYGNV